MFINDALIAYQRTSKMAILDKFFDFEDGCDPFAAIALHQSGEMFITKKMILDIIRYRYNNEYIYGIENRIRNWPLTEEFSKYPFALSGYQDGFILIMELYFRKILKTPLPEIAEKVQNWKKKP